MKGYLVIPAVVATLAGCSASEGGGDERRFVDGGGLSFFAGAEGTSGELSALCNVSLGFDDWQETRTGWSVSVSGEVLRVLEVGSNGAEFSALVAGEGTFEESWNVVTATLFGDQTGAAPFWQEIEILTGDILGDRYYEGPWNCAPLGIQLGPGVNDTALTVSGTWDLSPDK